MELLVVKAGVELGIYILKKNGEISQLTFLPLHAPIP